MCQASSWQSTTRASINSQQSLFLLFCQKFQITCFDQITGDLLSVYAIWLVTAGHLKSVASIRNYLSAVRTLCKMYGRTCHTPSSYPALEWTLTGIRRELQTPSQRKLPISPKIMLALVSHPPNISTLPWDQQILLRTVRAFYKIAYFSMLRCSNLLPAARTAVDRRR